MVIAPAVLTANPTAQSGKAARWIERARELLTQRGIAHEFIATEADGGTVGLVRRAIDEGGVRRVIYMGGDGTFAEVAKGILASQCASEVALGMLPTGTANDQGKSFGLEAGLAALERNVSVIAAGVTTMIDVGRIQQLDEGNVVTRSDLYFDSASIGWGASVLVTRNRDRQAVAEIPLIRRFYRDHLVYAGAMVKNIVKTYTTNMKFDLEAEIDGEVHHFKSLIDVIIKNTHVFGGEWVLAPDGEADDGKFELVPIAGRTEYTQKLIATLKNNPLSEDTLRSLGIELSRPIPGSSFKLTVLQPGTREPPHIQIDGEDWGSSDCVRIDVLPRILRIIVPREAAR